MKFSGIGFISRLTFPIPLDTELVVPNEKLDGELIKNRKRSMAPGWGRFLDRGKFHLLGLFHRYLIYFFGFGTVLSEPFYN